MRSLTRPTPPDSGAGPVRAILGPHFGRFGRSKQSSRSTSTFSLRNFALRSAPNMSAHFLDTIGVEKAGFGQVWPGFGHVWAEIGPTWPIWAESGLMSTQLADSTQLLARWTHPRKVCSTSLRTVASDQRLAPAPAPSESGLPACCRRCARSPTNLNPTRRAWTCGRKPNLRLRRVTTRNRAGETPSARQLPRAWAPSLGAETSGNEASVSDMRGANGDQNPRRRLPTRTSAATPTASWSYKQYRADFDPIRSDEISESLRRRAMPM